MTAKRKSASSKSPPKALTKPYEPTLREREAAAKAREAKAIAPGIESEMKDGEANLRIDHPDPYYGMKLMMDAIGAHDPAVFVGLVSQLENASLEKGKVSTNNLNFMLGVMKDIAPKDAVEAIDQWPARSAGFIGVCMIGGNSKTARRIAGGATGAPKNALSDVQIGFASSPGCAPWPERSFAREPETEIAWKTTFGIYTLGEGKPNGKCRFTLELRSLSAICLRKIERHSEHCLRPSVGELKC